MGRVQHSGSGTLRVAAVCLAAGVMLGCWLPRSRDAVWSDAAGGRSTQAVGQLSFADVVEQVSPGVVTVRARVPVGQVAEPSAVVSQAAERPVFDPEPGYRTGSGFVVNARGLVVTSRHVVSGASAIEVLVSKRGTYLACVVGEDVATDLALVRLEGPPSDLSPLAIGNSEELRAGDWIVAVGNPFGFSQTVTAGVVSFVGRHLRQSDLGVTSDFVQFSAPVNPGSSGCPVLDLQGRVVGVTTQAAAAAQGISFAVPSRTLKWALDAMARSKDGRVRRGYLGIEFASRLGTDETGSPNEGAVIVGVAEGEPAHRAGVRRGDVVLRVDGERVADATVLHDRIVRGDPGTKIALQLLREGRVQDPIEAVLGEVGGPRANHPSN